MTTTRRRGAALVREIRAAVLAEIAERGYADTTYDGVAARAGTSKPVLYRRWPSKAEMILDALVAAQPPLAAVPDTGSLAGDLVEFLSIVRTALGGPGRRTVVGLLAELDSAGGTAIRELLLARGTELLEPLVARARRRGELGDSPLPPAVLQLPLDLARHEILVGGALSDETRDAIVHQVVVPLFTLQGR